MYSRNYLSTDNYPILPPGYSGVALTRYAQTPTDPSDPDSLARRPVYEDIDIGSEEFSDEPDSVDKSSDEGSKSDKEKEKPDAESFTQTLPANRKIAKSSHDDILIAGIIMLLLSEGKCDELTLFLLGFLLL